MIGFVQIDRKILVSIIFEPKVMGVVFFSFSFQKKRGWKKEKILD